MQRPQASNSYDDVLRQQMKYLKTNKSSATCVSLTKPNELLQNKVEIVTIPVMTEIKEYSDKKIATLPSGHPAGFPTPFTMEHLKSAGARYNKKSLFKKRMMERKNIKPPTDVQEGVLRTSSEIAQIHEENVNRMANMSNSEIVIEREALITKMDPSMIEFLRKRKSDESNAGDVIPKPKDKVYKTDTGVDVKVPIVVDDKWINMKSVECDKLQWMQDMTVRKLKEDVKIRLDLHGEVVNPMSDISWREGLHHHGEDEQLAGYTLQELLGLSNSRFLKQRLIAFKAISGVIRNARLKRGDKSLIIAPKLLLQAGLIVVVRRELDSESLQSQSIAIDLLHSLIGPLLKTTYDPNWPCGTFTPFDANESESLGDGLIDHSAKELISALSYMLIIERFNFLLSSDLPNYKKLQLLEILVVFGHHSLSLAHKMFDNGNLCPTLVSLMEHAELEVEILNTFNAIIKNGNNLARKIFDMENLRSEILKLLFQARKPKSCDTCICLMTNLLKLGVAGDFVESILAKLVEDKILYAPIIINYYVCREKSEKKFEQLMAITRSVDHNLPTYLDYVTAVGKYGLKVIKNHIFSDIFSDILPFELLHKNVKTWTLIEKYFSSLSQINIISTPLPSLIYAFSPNSDVSFLQKIFDLLTTVYDVDKSLFHDFVKRNEINIPDFLTRVLCSFVLAAETENLLGSIVNFCMRGITDENDALVTACHTGGFRGCILLSSRYSHLQLKFLSSFFSGNAFKTDSNLVPIFSKTEIINENMTVNILSDLAPLRGMMINIIKQLINERTIECSRKFLEFSTCETLSFAGPGLTSSLPADLAFYKMIELGTIYSSLDHQNQTKNEMDKHATELIRCLKQVLYLYLNRPNSLIIEGSALFARLVSVFLCPPDISHTREVIKLMRPLLQIAVSKDVFVQNAVVPISGIPSFTDYFLRLCDSFEGQGYSLKIFAAVLMISFLHSVELRLITWGDRQPMLRTITNNMNELIIPFNMFTQQKETNTKLIQLYLAAVASKSVTYQRNEALYCYAIYQISNFIFNRDIIEKLRQNILILVLSAEKPIQEEILFHRSFMGPSIIRWKEDEFDEGKLRWIHSVKAAYRVK